MPRRPSSPPPDPPSSSGYSTDDVSGQAARLRLPPSLKALIALPSARGAALPAPPVARTHAILDRIRTQGERGGIGRDTWISLSTATLFTVNSPDSICQLYDYATDGNELAGKIDAAAIMRETGLKCISFGGVPRAINNLNALRAHLPQEVIDGLSKTPVREPIDPAANYERGRHLWDGIYEPHAQKLVDKLGDSHPDLPVHILNSHYGPLLSDPVGPVGPRDFRLGRLLTSVIAIAALRAQTGVGPQVTSHVFGLKKAVLPDGAPDGRDIQGQRWLVSDDGIRWLLESVDELSAEVRGDKE